MALLLDQDRLVASLEDVPDPVVRPVDGLRVDAVELTHAAREVGVGGLGEQMIVVGHQAVGVHRPGASGGTPGLGS
jgi:hypothetical protein